MSDYIDHFVNEYAKRRAWLSDEPVNQAKVNEFIIALSRAETHWSVEVDEQHGARLAWNEHGFRRLAEPGNALDGDVLLCLSAAVKTLSKAGFEVIVRRSIHGVTYLHVQDSF